jgi:hypothetical protein
MLRWSNLFLVSLVVVMVYVSKDKDFRPTQSWWGHVMMGGYGLGSGSAVGRREGKGLIEGVVSFFTEVIYLLRTPFGVLLVFL